MQPKPENQLLIFQDDEEIIQNQAPRDKIEVDNYQKMETIELHDQSESGADRNEYIEQVVSPNFNSLPSQLKGQQTSVSQLKKQQQKEPTQPNLVFSQQNAYSFRKQDLQPRGKTKPKQIVNEIDVISDFNSELSNNDALIQEQEQNTSGISRKNGRSRRGKNSSKFQDINDESSVKSIKLEEKVQKYKEVKTIVPNMMNQLKEKDNELDYYKTQDHLRHDKQDHVEKIKSMNEMNQDQNQNQGRRREKALPPINSHKSGQIFINTSGILQNDSSMVALKPKQDFNKLSMTNISSHTQMLHTDNDKVKKLSEKVVPIGKTLKCQFKRQKICGLSFWHPIYSFFYRNEKMILNAKKKCGSVNSNYNISKQQKYFDSGSQNYSGVLSGSFFGTTFNLYQCIEDVDELVCTIVYETECSCTSTFRKTEIYVKNEVFATQQLYRGNNSNDLNLKQLYYLGQNAKQKKIFKLINKIPEYNSQTGIYSLNFKGKCKMASVKNSVIVSQEDPNRYVLLFCKTDAHSFHTQISYPLSPFIAMGIILSSFDFKLFCQ